jgi:hypothetical protein
MAGYVVNKIPLQDRIFAEEISPLWQSTGTTLVNSASVSRFDIEGSIASAITAGDIIAFNKNISTGIAISNTVSTDKILDFNDTIVVGFWIKSDIPLVFNFAVQLLYPLEALNNAVQSQKSESVSIISGEWTFVQLSDRVLVTSDAVNYPISFTVTFTTIVGGTTANISISHPVIYSSLLFVDNPALLDIYKKIPEFIRHQDSLGANAPYPWSLARFLEMCIIHQGEITQILNDVIYSDISLGKDSSDATTLSTLVDPLVATRKHLFWLSQFSGTQIVNPITGVTPWANLPATWQGIDDLDGIPVTGNDIAPWDVIQDSNTEPAGLDAFLRWQVQYGYYGVNAGSKNAIIESVKRILSGTKQVTYSVSSPWNILVKTKITETPDTSLLDVGDSVSSIIDLIEYTRPLGCVVSHELI